jgi:hypothetical protein
VVLGVVGGRLFDDEAGLFAVLDAIRADRSGVWPGPHQMPKLGIARIVSGGAKGADTLAALYAELRQLPLSVHLPNWQLHGKRSGMMRNTLIVEEADMVIAFWDGSSRGTKDTIDKTVAAGKPLRIVRY